RLQLLAAALADQRSFGTKDRVLEKATGGNGAPGVPGRSSTAGSSNAQWRKFQFPHFGGTHRQVEGDRQARRRNLIYGAFGSFPDLGAPLQPPERHCHWITD